MFICGPSKGRKHKKYRMTRGPVLEDVELSSLSSLSIDFTLKSGSLLVFINFPLCENTVSYQLVALDHCKARLGDCFSVDACSAAGPSRTGSIVFSSFLQTRPHTSLQEKAHILFGMSLCAEQTEYTFSKFRMFLLFFKIIRAPNMA